MKGKILNYLIIIGVSIILLLGIVTTAFGQDNSKHDDTIINFDQGCEKYGLPIHSTNKKSAIGCIELGTSVEITEDNSKDPNLSSLSPI
ncbi:MAG: hypothetical protein F6K44_23810, partial [Moorea sp. SIO3E2]|nr:hypothetical protein [Moorena sp. SIO3E2]